MASIDACFLRILTIDSVSVWQKRKEGKVGVFHGKQLDSSCFLIVSRNLKPNFYLIFLNPTN